MSAININSQKFHSLMESEKPVLVDFWAPWCTYCRRIAPAYDQIAAQRGEEMLVTKVNIDDEPLLAHQEQIEVIPTLVLYRDGEVLGSIVAPESKAMIDQFIQDTLQK